MRDKIEDVVNNINTRINNSRELRFLNRGGCGFYAKYMKESADDLGLNAKIKVILDTEDFSSEDGLNYRKDTLKQLDNVINNLSANSPHTYAVEDTSFIHCFLDIEGVNFDSTHIGFKDITAYYKKEGSPYYKYSGEYTKKELDLCLTFGGWNPMYDRKHNRVLKTIIKEEFQKLKTA